MSHIYKKGNVDLRKIWRYTWEPAQKSEHLDKAQSFSRGKSFFLWISLCHLSSSFHTITLQESSPGKTNLSDLLMEGSHLTEDIKLPAGNQGKMKGETAHETIGIRLDENTEEIQHYCRGYLFCHGLSRCQL